MSDQAPATPPRQEDIDQRNDDEGDDQRNDDEGDDQRNDDERNDDEGDDDQGDDDDTFPRSYVQRLRERSNGYRLQLRERESEVETLQRRLFAERIQRLDLVVDDEAVPFDAALLDDNDALQEHIEGLLSEKPYLRKRKVNGNIGQHSSNGGGGSGVSLMDTLRHNAS